jgi:hypothetical protein
VFIAAFAPNLDNIDSSEVNLGEKNEEIAGTGYCTFIYPIFHLHTGTEKSRKAC